MLDYWTRPHTIPAAHVPSDILNLLFKWAHQPYLPVSRDGGFSRWPCSFFLHCDPQGILIH